MNRLRKRERRGAYAVELAIVAPIFFMLIFAQILGAGLVFDYIQMASLTREGARWASVHGYDYRYEKDMAAGNALGTTPIITNADVYTNAIGPKAILMVGSISSSSVTLTWQSTVTGTAYDDQIKYYDSSSNSWKQNYVTVATTMTWNPIVNVWGVGSKTVNSSSTVAVVY